MYVKLHSRMIRVDDRTPHSIGEYTNNAKIDTLVSGGGGCVRGDLCRNADKIYM